ncbi:RteC domain-containing protein [Pedobacter lithocola]|uniref:RteC domain-containing protein n=1 Tax=Pedobacter lithocola TaxID=1908239 RepID=A0ABV8PDI0_9SPHI
MRKKCELLLGKLRVELEEVETMGLSPIEKLKSYLSLTNSCVATMKATILEDPFISEADEIEFFKVWKPKVYGLLIYAAERYSYEIARPLLVDGYADFYNQQLNYISKFFRQHEFIYQYYRFDMSEMDSVYFLRGKKPDGLFGIDIPELDNSFATAGDYLFAKFIGLEMMQDLILSDIKGPKSTAETEVKSRKGRSLRWTGDSTNLIELLYGLAETKQFNDGDIDISDMVDVFEQVFNVNLSNYFRRFTTIKRRKSVSKTRFLDEMVQAVNKRIDDADAYVPAWAK